MQSVKRCYENYDSAIPSAASVGGNGKVTPNSRSKQAPGGGDVAKIIEFYIPSSFRRSSKWIPENERGKIIEFSSWKKSA